MSKRKHKQAASKTLNLVPNLGWKIHSTFGNHYEAEIKKNIDLDGAKL